MFTMSKLKSYISLSSESKLAALVIFYQVDIASFLTYFNCTRLNAMPLYPYILHEQMNLLFEQH